MMNKSKGGSALFQTIAVAFIALSFLGSSAASAQRKVYSNEDVERPAPAPPPAPAAEETAAPAPSATQPAPAPEAVPAGPQAELKKASDLQAILKQAFDELSGKMDAETVAALKERWTIMADCLSNLLQNNQQTINELQGKIVRGQLRPQAPGQQTPAP